MIPEPETPPSAVQPFVRSPQDALPMLGVLVSGRGSNLAALLDAIERRELRACVGLVVSSRADAPALERAAAYAIPTVVIAPRAYTSRAAEGAAVVAALQQAHVDIVVLAGYARILDASVVRAYPLRILNIHPSLLPAFAGGMAPRPQAEALHAGVKLAGCTVHFVTEEVDGGPILAQAAVPVEDGDDVNTLSARILAAEHRLLPQAVAHILSGCVWVDGKRTYFTPPQ